MNLCNKTSHGSFSIELKECIKFLIFNLLYKFLNTTNNNFDNGKKMWRKTIDYNGNQEK